MLLGPACLQQGVATHDRDRDTVSRRAGDRPSSPCTPPRSIVGRAGTAASKNRPQIHLVILPYTLYPILRGGSEARCVPDYTSSRSVRDGFSSDVDMGCLMDKRQVSDTVLRG